MNLKTLMTSFKACVGKHTVEAEKTFLGEVAPSEANQPESLVSKLHFDADRPIHNDDQDRLGFRVIAENLAQSVLSRSTDEGLVIGIEGSWGSGKSSILNLLCSHVKKEHKNASVIPFAPWVIGNRDDMVASLIASIASEIEKHEPPNKTKDVADGAVSLSKKLRKYGAMASRLSPLANVASALSLFPGAATVAQTLEALKEGDVSEAKISVSALKDELVTGLQKLGRRFIVVIDDVDRLEPTEATEITRLIRAVGDFPNIVYLLCYDKDILAKSLEAALKIQDGKSYLQKIVQVSFPVPRPQPFDLRRWLLEECHALYATITEKHLPKDVADRLSVVCDVQGGGIQTPREIGLVLNALRLYYPPVAGKVDFADLCWLQITRVKNEALYKWVEQYLSDYSVISVGEATIGSHERRNMANELLKILKILEIPDDTDNDHSIRAFMYLQEYLPGIAPHVLRTPPEQTIFNTLDEENKTELEAKNRLASPLHYRLYFAFNQPAGVLDDAALQAIIQKASNSSKIQDDLMKLIEENRPQGGSMYELFLDRFKRQNIDHLSVDARKVIARSIADTIDAAQYKEKEPGFFQTRSLYTNGRRVFDKILKTIPDPEKGIFLESIFKDARSLGWLMSEIIGTEWWNHGLVNKEKERVDKQIFTKDELSRVTSIMLERLKGKDKSYIASVPLPLNFFYRWSQSGGEKDVKAWMQEVSQTDSGFLDLMNKCRSWSASSNRGVYHPLHKRDLNSFMDAEAAVKRIQSIAETTKSDRERQLANELLEAVSLSRDGD